MVVELFWKFFFLARTPYRTRRPVFVYYITFSNGHLFSHYAGFFCEDNDKFGKFCFRLLLLANCSGGGGGFHSLYFSISVSMMGQTHFWVEVVVVVVDSLSGC